MKDTADKIESTVDREIIESYIETLTSLQRLMSAKVGAFTGDSHWDSHSKGINAMIQVSGFIDSAKEFLEVKAGIRDSNEEGFEPDEEMAAALGHSNGEGAYL